MCVNCASPSLASDSLFNNNISASQSPLKYFPNFHLERSVDHLWDIYFVDVHGLFCIFCRNKSTKIIYKCLVRFSPLAYTATTNKFSFLLSHAFLAEQWTPSVYGNGAIKQKRRGRKYVYDLREKILFSPSICSAVRLATLKITWQKKVMSNVRKNVNI